MLKSSKNGIFSLWSKKDAITSKPVYIPEQKQK